MLLLHKKGKIYCLVLVLLSGAFLSDFTPGESFLCFTCAHVRTRASLGRSLFYHP